MRNSKLFKRSNYYSQIAEKYPIWSPEEELAIFKQYKLTPTKQLRDTIVKHNLRILIKLCNRYRDEDIFHEGMLGLLIAIDKFNIEDGFRFFQFASLWIRSKLQWYFKCQKRSLPFPFHRAVKLDQTVSQNNNLTYEEVIADTKLSSEELFITQQTKYQVNKFCNNLADNELKVITGRLEEKTLDEIGQELNLSRQRVHQVEKLVVSKFKEYQEVNKIN